MFVAVQLTTSFRQRVALPDVDLKVVVIEEHHEGKRITMRSTCLVYNFYNFYLCECVRIYGE